MEASSYAAFSAAAYIHEMASDGRGGRHRGTHQMRAATGALAAFEIAVRGGCTALAGREAIVVHAEAHGAAGVAPLEARLLEHAIEAFLLGLRFHEARARHHEGELVHPGKSGDVSVWPDPNAFEPQHDRTFDSRDVRSEHMMIVPELVSGNYAADDPDIYGYP